MDEYVILDRYSMSPERNETEEGRLRETDRRRDTTKPRQYT